MFDYRTTPIITGTTHVPLTVEDAGMGLYKVYYYSNTPEDEVNACIQQMIDICNAQPNIMGQRTVSDVYIRFAEQDNNGRYFYVAQLD